MRLLGTLVILEISVLPLVLFPLLEIVSQRLIFLPLRGLKTYSPRVLRKDNPFAIVLEFSHRRNLINLLILLSSGIFIIYGLLIL